MVKASGMGLNVGCLHLAFYTVKISLHRAMLRAVKQDIVLARACRADAMLTAGRVVNLVRRLTNENTKAFWYPCTPSHQSWLTTDSRVNFSIVGTFLLALLFTS